MRTLRCAQRHTMYGQAGFELLKAPEEHLDLLEPNTSRSAEPRTGSPEVMRCELEAHKQ